jgi:hypothetical protein
MKRFWISLAIAIPLVLMFWMAVMHFDPSCGEEIKEEQRSPDGRYVAVLMERNCGATTRYVEHINIRPANRSFSTSFFAGTTTEGEIFTLEDRNGGPVQFEWAGKTLRVHYPADGRIVRKQPNWNDVDIAYVF